MTRHEQGLSCSAVSDAKRRAFQSHRRLTFHGRRGSVELLGAARPEIDIHSLSPPLSARLRQSRRAAGLRETPRTSQGPPHRRLNESGLGKALYAPGRQEHATHKPLIRLVIVAEVPLAGLSFKFHGEWNYEIRPQAEEA
jgi:hypothetical protein